MSGLEDRIRDLIKHSEEEKRLGDKRAEQFYNMIDALETGEVNTASNVGVGGVGLYNAKVGVDLQFRNINAASARISVALDAGNKEVDIDVVQAQIDHGSIGGLAGDDHSQYYNAARHTKAVHDALGINADLVDGEHASAIVTNARVKAHFPDTIANILSNHTKAVHDSLGINSGLVDGFHASQTRNSANTCAVRDGSGYLQLGWINTTSGVASATLTRVYCSQDAYIRYMTPADFCAQMRDADYVHRIVFNTSLTNLAGSMTEATTWQDLDLTAYTSANAKGVIVCLRYSRLLGNNTHVSASVLFRKNGTTVLQHAKVEDTWDNRSGANQTFYSSDQIWIPCDTGQIIEWKVGPNTSTLINEFYVVGYWE